MVGLSRPSFAVKLLRNSAWHSGGCWLLAFDAPLGGPPFAHTRALDHFSRFTFAVEFDVNSPPPPKVAPTSCTTSLDSSHVVVMGCVLVSMFSPIQIRRCCGGLLSLCLIKLAMSLSAS